MKGIVKGSKCIKCGCWKWIKGKLTADTTLGFLHCPYTCKNCGHEYSLLDYITVDKVDASTITVKDMKFDKDSIRQAKIVSGSVKEAKFESYYF